MDGGEGIENSAADAGVGGASIAALFVIPLQTVLANRDVNPEGAGPCCAGSAAFPPLYELSVMLSSSSTAERAGDEGVDDTWFVKPLHTVSLSRAVRLALSA